MFVWSDEKIRFLKDASEYTPFNDALAARIAPHLPPNAHLLDAGCGLGYLSLALAPYCARVTAMDVSENALAVLRENIALSGVRNIDVREGDVFHLPEDCRFDAMVFCFFGSVSETLGCIRRHCRGKAVLLKKNWQTHRFTLRETPLARFTFAQTCAELRALGVPHESSTFSLDMGQPFRTPEDAAAFFRMNRRSAVPDAITVSEVSDRLTKTGDSRFPYYLPAERPIGMILINAKVLPDALNTNSKEEVSS